MTEMFEGLDFAMDEESYEYLRDNYPIICMNVEKAVKLGAAPDMVRHRVLIRMGSHRIELATRCEAAARYLYGVSRG